MQKTVSSIILYTSNFCGHAHRVERFFAKHEIPVKLLNVDLEPAARQELIELNNGFASVPTVVFPDGSWLTEPSIGHLCTKLELENEDAWSSQRSKKIQRS